MKKDRCKKTLEPRWLETTNRRQRWAWIMVVLGVLALISGIYLIGSGAIRGDIARAIMGLQVITLERVIGLEIRIRELTK